MDLDKLIKEAYLLKNKEDNINKLYEMVETMLALQESGLLKEEEQEDISVDLGYLDTILNQPPPAKDPAKQAAREFYDLWKDRDDDYSLINDFKYKTDYYEEVRSRLQNQGPGNRVEQQDSAIQIIKNFLNTADNIDPKILDYMSGFNDTVKGQIRYDAAVQKFKDSDDGGVPDRLEKDNNTNPNNQNDDLEPYQTRDATEPEPEVVPTAPTAAPEQAASITQPNIIRDSQTLSKIIETAVGETVISPDQLMKGLQGVAEFSKIISTSNKKATLFGEDGAYNAENASKLVLLDYINSMISEFESTIGGYSFEYLLAALSGGRQTGTQTNDDGKIGAIDFVFGDNSLGSSKLYGTFQDVKQSINGFKGNKLKKDVFYIIAIKEKRGGGKKPDGPVYGVKCYTCRVKLNEAEPIKLDSSNVNKVFNALTKPLKLYSKLNKSDDNEILWGNKLMTHYYDFYMNDNFYPVLTNLDKNGKATTKQIKLNKKAVKQFGMGNKVPDPIIFYGTETSSFREQLNQSYEANSARLIQVLSDIIQNIKNTKKETETYFATGNIDDGINAFSAVYKTEKGLEEMAGSISGDPQEVKQTKTRAKAENT
jgi:hypothetical protein